MAEKNLAFRHLTKEHYDQLAPSYIELRQPYGAQRRRDTIFDLCRLLEIGYLLDAGAADGMMSGRLADLGWSVTAVDISARLLKLPLERSFSQVVADVETMPLRDSIFDLVVCTEVFEHLADYRRAVQEISRIMKSGGHAVVSVPNPLWEPFFRIADKLKMKVPETTTHKITQSQVVAAMRQSGFITLEQKGVILWPFSRPHLVQKVSLKIESRFPRLCATLISMHIKRSG
jgi:2-polyprenyl-3-methyl-5-hydroxy-6-metoxy-1,4-benzoquinol methylase